jgi:DHA1 family bicyclomycin/chloramphenicol resistance-like MFS transporter
VAFRFFQAIGGCVGMVAARAMVRDLFEVKDNAKVFSTLMLVVAVSPIIAPTLGGYLSALVGWRSIFLVLLGIIMLIIAGIYFLLPESKKPDPNYSLKPASILKSFGSVIRNYQFAMYTCTAAVAYAGLYAYISGSPFVFMVLFKVTEQEYGWIFAIVAAGLISATQFNTLLLKKFSSEQVVRVALYTQTLIGFVLASTSIFQINELYSTVTLIFLFLCCQGFIFPNASALSMAPFAHNAGSASALMGFIQMSIGAIMSAVVSVLQNGTSLPMIGVMSLCSFSASIMLAFSHKRLLKKASKELVEEEEVEMISTI